MSLTAGCLSKNVIKILSLSLLSSIVFVLAFFTMQNVFAQSSQESWKLYTDPENEFSIEYPTSWELKPAENRFDLVDLHILHSNALNGIVSIKDNVIPEELTQFIKEQGANQKDIEDAFEIIFPHLLTSFSAEMDSFNQIEAADYNKYKIDGHKAASTIFSFKQSELDFAGWMVMTIIGNKMFSFNYIANQNQFDTNFPIAERMLNSIKILEK